MTSPNAGPLKVAIIGCGRRQQTLAGYGMAHRHAAGYAASARCTLVAAVDLNRASAEAFIAEHAPGAAVFTDFREMMRTAKPDIVSVCLWPNLHAAVVGELATFRPRAIFCEKPMDVHWDAAVRMHEVCREHGVRLLINHQRRFNRPMAHAKERLDRGEIGRLLRLEGAWHNLADAGTHVLDLMFFYNGDTDADWVLGQIDLRGAVKAFGAINPGHGITEFRFKNGVRALYRFGRDHAELGCLLRLIGENGVIEILFEAPWLRIRRASQVAWEILDTGESIHDDLAIHRAIADLISCLETGALPQLASERALRATEIIFATHASAGWRRRVDLPLAPGPCVMLTLLASGELQAELSG